MSSQSSLHTNKSVGWYVRERTFNHNFLMFQQRLCCWFRTTYTLLESCCNGWKLNANDLMNIFSNSTLGIVRVCLHPSTTVEQYIQTLSLGKVCVLGFGFRPTKNIILVFMVLYTFLLSEEMINNLMNGNVCCLSWFWKWKVVGLGRVCHNRVCLCWIIFKTFWTITFWHVLLPIGERTHLIDTSPSCVCEQTRRMCPLPLESAPTKVVTNNLQLQQQWVFKFCIPGSAHSSPQDEHVVCPSIHSSCALDALQYFSFVSHMKLSTEALLTS